MPVELKVGLKGKGKTTHLGRPPQYFDTYSFCKHGFLKGVHSFFTPRRMCANMLLIGCGPRCSRECIALSHQHRENMLLFGCGPRCSRECIALSHQDRVNMLLFGCGPCCSRECIALSHRHRLNMLLFGCGPRCSRECIALSHQDRVNMLLFGCGPRCSRECIALSHQDRENMLLFGCGPCCSGSTQLLPEDLGRWSQDSGSLTRGLSFPLVQSQNTWQLLRSSKMGRRTQPEDFGLFFGGLGNQRQTLVFGV